MSTDNLPICTCGALSSGEPHRLSCPLGRPGQPEDWPEDPDCLTEKPTHDSGSGGSVEPRNESERLIAGGWVSPEKQGDIDGEAFAEWWNRPENSEATRRDAWSAALEWERNRVAEYALRGAIRTTL